MNLRDWIDSRTGYRSVLRHILDEPVLGGARWAYVFGSALAVLFLLQATTGVLLALYYSPSTQEAWGSVYYVSTQVNLGWFVRGLHHFGSSAMVVLLVAHMFQVFIYGAYRKPREFAWWTGLVLFAITLGFSLTGYLLPWDQKGYWATQVVSSIAGSLPWVGTSLKAVLLGGNDFGNLTLTRFFGVHVFVLPGALITVLAVHILLFRRHGVSPHWARTPEQLEKETEPFWPRQLTYDLAFVSLLFGVLLVLVVRNHGAPLDAPADPGSSYLARPEWYFMWLFQLLHFLPGAWEGTGILAFTLLAGAFLFALPFADRAPSASLRQRWPHVVVAGGLAASVAVLTIWPMLRDLRDPAVVTQAREAEQDSRRALALAAQGIPPGGAEDLYLNDPHERGLRLFAVHCQACHKFHGRGGESAPDLTRYMSREWVRGVIVDPTSPAYFGKTKVSAMDPTEASPKEIDLLTDYVLSLGGTGREAGGGAALFDEKGCAGCHARAGEEPLSGPTLAGYGSRSWMLGAIKNPRHAMYYGDEAEMPAFDGKLTEQQFDDLLTCILSEMPRRRGGR